MQEPGAPHAVAQHVATLPPVSSMFAAVLGENPVAHLLGPTGALSSLSPAHLCHPGVDTLMSPASTPAARPEMQNVAVHAPDGECVPSRMWWHVYRVTPGRGPWACRVGLSRTHRRRGRWR